MKFLLPYLFLLMLMVSTAHAADVTLNWNPNTESDLAGYKLYQSTVSGQYGAPVATLGKVTTHTLTLPQLEVDATYFFRLTAYDLAGNESTPSLEVRKLVAGVPPPPLVEKPGMPVLTVAAHETELLVAWQPVSNGAGGTALMNVRLGRPTDHWGLMVTQNCLSSPCRITGLQGGMSYQVQAVAYRVEPSGNVFGPLSAPVSVTTLAPVPVDLPPAQPQGLQITSSTAEQIVIVASVADCPRVRTATKGSTTTRAMRTIQCVR